jgi:hypothetical protein
VTKNNWLSLPDRYLIQKELSIQQFLQVGLDRQKKKKLRQDIKAIYLLGQIAGEEIPSLITEEINCQAILFLNVQLSHIKEAQGVSSLMHQIVKPFAVLRMEDTPGKVLYAFAMKRLNKLDIDQIVLEQVFLYAPPLVESSLPYPFDKILQQSNKHLFYMELFLRHLISSKSYVWSQLSSFQSSSIWYQQERMQSLISLIMQGDSMVQSLKQADDIAEKARLNEQYKQILHQLETLKKEVN